MMATYLMRVRGDNSGKLVGVASVNSLKDLWLTVDEHCDPGSLEYVRIHCSMVAMLAENDLQPSEDAQRYIPPADWEIEEFGETPTSRGAWRNFHDLCGGERKFDKMYREIYSLHSGEA